MKKCVLIFILLIANFILFAQKNITGTVIGISDGDTFSLLTKEKIKYKIRLAHIDCPEKNQAFGRVAKRALSELIYLKNVQINYKSTDRNGRIIGEVFLEKKLINLILVEKGFAWHFKKYSNDIRFSNAEIYARKNKIGLWIDKNPISPWDYRKK
jgi:micrococcal nuclease